MDTSTHPEGDPGRAKRLLAFVLRARSGPRSPRTRSVLALASFAIFAAGFAIAYSNLPPLHDEPDWAMLSLLLVVGVPLALLWNAAEYHLILAAIGRTQPLSRTIRISVVAAAANLLPLPGSALVRAREIYKISGAGRDVVRATATAGLAFMGTAAALTGGFLLVPGPRGLAAGALAAGALMLIISAGLMRQKARRPVKMFVALLLVEAGSVLTKALRYHIVLRALDYEPGAQEVFALTLMAVLALATGIFPGGIGGSELLAAAISPFIGLTVAAAVVTSALDNLAQYVGLVLPTTIVAATGPRHAAKPEGP